MSELCGTCVHRDYCFDADFVQNSCDYYKHEKTEDTDNENEND